MKRMGRILSLVIPMLLLLGHSSLEARTRRVSGVVTDLEGKPIKGAKVTISAKDRALDWSGKTNKKGKWAIWDTRGDVLTFTVEAEGFQTYTEEKGYEDLGRKKTINFKLAPEGIPTTPQGVPMVPTGEEAPPALDLADLKLGNELFDQGKYPEAIAAYNIAQEKNPDIYKINLRIAQANIRLDNLDGAKVAYEKALEFEADNDIALSGLAYIYLKQKNQDKGVEMLKKLLEKDPTNDYANFQVGQILFGQGKAKEAKPYFDAVVAAKPDKADAHLQLGYVNMNLGNSEDAVACFQKYLELKPDASDAQMIQETIDMLK